MGRRVLAFFLGFLLGIIFVFGAVAGALYLGATVMHPSDVYPESDKFLGDLANMSLYDIYNSITALYKDKVGITGENGKYFTLGEFLEHYHINASELFGGKEVPSDVLDVPIFEFINTENSTNAMRQIKVSALFAFVNMFTEGEEGGGLFSQEMLEKLAAHNMAELVDEELGMVYVFQNVTLADVLPGIFPTTDNAESMLMWGLGQSSVGRLLAGFEGSILRQFKENGAFEALGSLKITQLLGENSQILSAIVKDYKVCDLIDDDGNLNPDGIMNGLYLGDLLGLKRNLLTDVQTDGFSFQATHGDVTVYANDDDCIICVKTIDGEYEYFEGRLFCSITDSEHVHDVDCFGFTWYNQEDTPTTGMYAAIADITVGDLMSGSSDAIIDRFLELKLGEILEGQEVSGAINHLKDMTLRALLEGGIDNIYFGVIFEYARKQETNLDGWNVVEDTAGKVMQKDGNYVRLDGNTWFEAEFDCDGEHDVHNAKCYPFVWYTNPSYENRGVGIKAALANTTIGELNSINSFIMDLTLTEVFGNNEIPSMLQSLSDVKIRDLNTAINDMYLGNFLNYHREEKNGEYVWYVCDPQEGEDHVHSESCLATGMMAKFADQKISDLSNIQGLISDLTLFDVLGEDVPQMLKSIQDTKISELSTALEELRIGELFEYHSEMVDGVEVWYKCNHENAGDHQEDCLVTGVMGKLAGKKITELSDLNSTIMELTLYDVMGDKVPDSLKSIQNTPISELEGAMQAMYLGQFLEYTRDKVDVGGYSDYYSLTTVKYFNDGNGNTLYARLDKTANIYYAAVLDCSNSIHAEGDHTEECFYFKWYSPETSEIVPGVMGKLASIPLGELSVSGMDRVIRNTTLGDVLGDVGDNVLLNELKDVKIKDLSSELNSLYVGTAMGYFRLEAEGFDTAVGGISGLYSKTDGGNVYYALFDADKNKKFNAQLICVDKSSEHTHTAACYGYVWYECNSSGTEGHTHSSSCATSVKGLNAKMSNLTLQGLSGNEISKILAGLTLGDLSESGILTGIEGENVYKLAIITCKNENHKCNGHSSYLVTTHTCTIKDYVAYSAEQTANGGQPSAKDFWLDTHGGIEDDEHLNAWKNLAVAEFMNELLNAL